MRFLLDLSLFLALISSSKPCAASVTSIRGGEKNAVTGNDAANQKLQRGTRILSEGRRLLPMEGTFRTLIIRVKDSAGNEPQTDAQRETDTWFGTHGLTFANNQNSLASLYDQCSGGKTTFSPATGPNVIDGVIEFIVGEDLNHMPVGDAGTIVRNAFNQLNTELGIEFDAYSIILPVGVAGRGGLAGQGGDHQYYAGGADRSLELVMHEFGHNLGFHHSGIPDEGDYDDNSCMMGCCAGAQQMCFNAAKSWFTGWYTEAGKEGHQDLNFFDTPGQWWKGKLVGIDDYLNDIFDENQHRVVARTPGLFTMFNRAKGVNAGVKAYPNQVVVVQQWGGRERSKVLAVLDKETPSFTFSSEHFNFDVTIKVCQITIPPFTTGPQIIGGTASQSSTKPGQMASLAIDGNLDNTWSGGSITHTEGNDLDPWWRYILDEEEAVEHIRVHNRGDCCGSRLNNAFIELFDGNGDLVLSRNMGTAETVNEVFLKGIYNVKEVLIRLQGDKVLSLAEVQLFAPTPGGIDRLPDFAEIITYVTDRSDPVHLPCEHTMAPTMSALPSSNPTVSLQPTETVWIPTQVVLVRNDVPCILQQNPSHPDRYKCTIQSTGVSNEPGTYGNEVVTLQGEDGCVVVIRPVTWAYRGNLFIFESSEDLNTINECFTPGTLITENAFTPNPATVSPTHVPTTVPTAVPTLVPTPAPTPAPSDAPTVAPTATPTQPTPIVWIPTDVVLVRNDVPCIFQINPTNHPDRYKCIIQSTGVSNEPGTYGNEAVTLQGKDGCVVVIRPVTWAYKGNMFIFESSKDLNTINECFAPGTLITENAFAPNPVTVSSTADPTAAPTDSEDCEDDTKIKFLVGENKKKTRCKKIKASQCNTEYETKSGGTEKPKKKCPSICNKKCVCAEDPKKEYVMKVVTDGKKLKCEKIKKEGLCNAKLKSTGGKAKIVCPVSCKYKDCK